MRRYSMRAEFLPHCALYGANYHASSLDLWVCRILQAHAHASDCRYICYARSCSHWISAVSLSRRIEHQGMAGCAVEPACTILAEYDLVVSRSSMLFMHVARYTRNLRGPTSASNAQSTQPDEQQVIACLPACVALWYAIRNPVPRSG